jgi:D-alanyl-D-alanine carboxypeptidase
VRAGVDYSKEWQVEEVFDQFVLDPYGPPGTVQHYSSTNYLLITEILEIVTGSSVPEEIERSFLEPLRLEHTLVSMGELPPAGDPVAHPWVDIDRDGNLDDLHGIPQTWIASLTHPVMFSTPADLAHWMQALYDEGAVLSPSSLDEMLAYPQVAQRDPEGGLYGLGVVDYSDILGMQVFGHGGSALGYSAAALYLPEYRTSVVWLINTGESPVALANRMMGDAWASLSEVIRTHQQPE